MLLNYGDFECAHVAYLGVHEFIMYTRQVFVNPSKQSS